MSAYEKQLTWDREVGEFVAVEPGQRVRTPNDNWWDKAYYGPSLEIASHARNALLAMVAIIRHRNKEEPFVFGNVTMKQKGLEFAPDSAPWYQLLSLRQRADHLYLRYQCKRGG